MPQASLDHFRPPTRLSIILSRSTDYHRFGMRGTKWTCIGFAFSDSSHGTLYCPSWIVISRTLCPPMRFSLFILLICIIRNRIMCWGLEATLNHNSILKSIKWFLAANLDLLLVGVWLRGCNCNRMLWRMVTHCDCCFRDVFVSMCVCVSVCASCEHIPYVIGRRIGGWRNGRGGPSCHAWGVS